MENLKENKKISSLIWELELKLIKEKIDLVRFYNLIRGQELMLTDFLITKSLLINDFNPYIEREHEVYKEKLLFLITEEELNNLLNLQIELATLKKENNLKDIFNDSESRKRMKQYAWICSKTPDFKTENIQDADMLQSIIWEDYFSINPE